VWHQRFLLSYIAFVHGLLLLKSCNSKAVEEQLHVIGVYFQQLINFFKIFVVIF